MSQLISCILFQGIIGSFIESAGLSLYVIGTLSVIAEADITIVLMNALFIVPVFWQMSKACLERFATAEDPNSRRLLKKTRKKSITNMFLSFFAILLQLGGLVGIVFMVRNLLVFFSFAILLVFLYVKPSRKIGVTMPRVKLRK